MLRLCHILALAAFFSFLAAPSSEAEARGSDFADVEFYFSKTGIGDTYDLEIEEPTSDRPKYWKARDDPNQAEQYFPLVNFERNMGGSLALGDSYSYVIWVESTNVQEIRFKTTLFITWIDYSGDEPKTTMTNISVDEVGKSAPCDPVCNFLSENYTLELESSSIDKSEFPNGVPPYTTFGLILETSVTWAPDTQNRTVWVKAGSTDFESSFIMNFRHVNIVNDYTGYFSNDRVDESGEDSLFIKVNVTNALGADNLDISSASIEVQSVAGGGSFKDSIIVKDKHTYAKYIQGTWWYQEDQGVTSGSYSIELSIKDIWGNEWSSQISYDLVVDEYDLGIEFGEGYSADGQLPRGGKVDYEFMVQNIGNTRDIFEIELDDSDLPSGWEATLQSQETLDLPEGQYGYVQVRVEAPVSAPGGSDEVVKVTVTSVGNSQVNEIVRLETTVRTYGVAFVSPPDEISIDPENLDIDGYYTFSVKLRNTGSDKDTYKLDVTTARSDWTVRVEIGGNEIQSVTIGKSQTETIDIVLKPINYDDSLGDIVGFLLTADSISPGDGSATLSMDLTIDIPLDRVTDLSVSMDEVLINGKLAALAQDDITAGEPIQIQVTVNNNGGKSTGSFGVKLYLGQLVIDEYTVSQGISGFGSEPVVLNWESPSPGSHTLKIFVDFEQQVDESNSNRINNNLGLPVFVSEKTELSEENSGADPLLIGPGSIATFSVLTFLSFIYRRNH